MINSKIFTDKINEIEKRIKYIIDNLNSDPRIIPQEVRFVFLAYLYGTFTDKKVKKLAELYFEKRTKERERVDREMLLTMMACVLVINKNPDEYWTKIKERINSESENEKYSLAMHLLTLITPKFLKKIDKDDKQYIQDLLDELKKQSLEYKLFSLWTEMRLFEKNPLSEIRTISQDEIEYLKEYLLWEMVNLESGYESKQPLRHKFVLEITEYSIQQLDWIIFLLHIFLKRHKIYFISEKELNKKIETKVRSKINKKVYFPLISMIIFLVIKLWKKHILFKPDFGFYANLFLIWKPLAQILLLIVGTFLLLFEERLPQFEIPIKRTKLTFGQIGEGLIVLAILWSLELSNLISKIFKFIL